MGKQKRAAVLPDKIAQAAGPQASLAQPAASPRAAPEDEIDGVECLGSQDFLDVGLPHEEEDPFGLAADAAAEGEEANPFRLGAAAPATVASPAQASGKRSFVQVLTGNSSSGVMDVDDSH